MSIGDILPIFIIYTANSHVKDSDVNWRENEVKKRIPGKILPGYPLFLENSVII